jgi:hypothetical protein
VDVLEEVDGEKRSLMYRIPLEMSAQARKEIMPASEDTFDWRGKEVDNDVLHIHIVAA